MNDVWGATMKMKRAVLGVLVTSIAAVMLGLQLMIHSQAQRAILILIAVSLICCVWIKFSKGLSLWPGKTLLGSGLLTVVVVCLWSALNIARFRLYNAAIEGDATYSHWYETICRAQVVLQWSVALLALAFVVVLTAYTLSGRILNPSGK